MRRWSVALLMLLGLVLSACAGTAGSAPALPVEAAIVFVTASPAPPATATPPPSPTSTQAVVTTAVPDNQIETAASPEPVFTDTPTPAPTPTPTPEPDWLNTVGRTDDGLVYLGNPEAPVTMVDYSDFM